ncbi:hypothetical protein B8043_05910 [Klebsiella aerogenes]|nr:hypothetical protein AM407_06320 [Klebsiella aerogenes]OVK42397.1 hypothetical protein B8043_05910 [Klebsiella aerogenes]
MLVASKSPVALPLTGATALYDLVALLSAAQAGGNRVLVRHRFARDNRPAILDNRAGGEMSAFRR